MVRLLCVVMLASALACSEEVHRHDDAKRIDVPVGRSLQNPAFSPDGKALVFTNFRGGYNSGPAHLVVVQLDDGSTRALVSDGSDNVNLPGSTWNASSDRVVFSSSRPPHDEIYTIASDGGAGTEQRVTDRAANVAYEPSFAPMGDAVVFESHLVDVEGDGVITSYALDGSTGYVALTDAGDDCRQPNWSPAGDLIVYQRFSGGQWDLWVMSPDGANKRQLTSGDGDETDASFSPDGSWVVYSGYVSSRDTANLFIVRVADGVTEPVTNTDGYDGAPSWSPDGARIAFESVAGDPDNSDGAGLWWIEAPPDSL